MVNKRNVAPYINSATKVLSGVLVSILLLINIKNESRGVFYAMQSLLAAQILFDGGMSLVLLKRTSRVVRNNCTQPGRYSERRISLYLNFLKSWGIYSFILYTLVVTPLGYIYLSSTIELSMRLDWEFPWVLASLFSGAMFLIRSKQIYLESSLDINFVQLSSAFVTFVSLSVLAVMILFEFALYGLAAYYFAMFVVSYFIFKERHASITKINFSKEKFKVKFIKKFLKSQTKLFLTYSIGFFYWNSLPLIVFRFLGPEVAGKWGVVNSMLNGIGQLSNSRLVANISLHARDLSAKRNDATVHFEKMMIVSTIIFVVLSFSFGLFLYHSITYFPIISNRITGWGDYFLMLGYFLLNIIVGNLALAGRLVKNEPYFIFSLVTNIATPILLFLTARTFNNLMALLVLNFVIHAVYVVWAHTIYCKIFRRG